MRSSEIAGAAPHPSVHVFQLKTEYRQRDKKEGENSRHGSNGRWREVPRWSDVNKAQRRLGPRRVSRETEHNFERAGFLGRRPPECCERPVSVHPCLLTVSTRVV